jgi:hypothetical protein
MADSESLLLLLEAASGGLQAPVSAAASLPAASQLLPAASSTLPCLPTRLDIEKSGLGVFASKEDICQLKNYLASPSDGPLPSSVCEALGILGLPPSKVKEKLGKTKVVDGRLMQETRYGLKTVLVRIKSPANIDGSYDFYSEAIVLLVALLSAASCLRSGWRSIASANCVDIFKAAVCTDGPVGLTCDANIVAKYRAKIPGEAQLFALIKQAHDCALALVEGDTAFLESCIPVSFPLFLGEGMKPAPERTVFILPTEEWPRLMAYKCSIERKEYRLKESNANKWASVVQLQCVCGARGAASKNPREDGSHEYVAHNQRLLGAKQCCDSMWTIFSPRSEKCTWSLVREEAKHSDTCIIQKAELGLPRRARVQLLQYAAVSGGSRWQAIGNAQACLDAEMELLRSSLDDFGNGRYKAAKKFKLDEPQSKYAPKAGLSEPVLQVARALYQEEYRIALSVVLGTTPNLSRVYTKWA